MSRGATSSFVLPRLRLPTPQTTPNKSSLSEIVTEFAPVFTRAQAVGGLGPGDFRRHIAHALAYLDAYPELAQAERVLDLGSGAGLPGLVLARQLPAVVFVLLEGRAERARALRRSVAELGFSARVSVLGERAETAAHRLDLRFSFDVVVARAFAPAAATAECGAGFLAIGGALVVSEPPEAAIGDRWPATGIARLGLCLGVSGNSPPFRFAVLRSVTALDERYPRRIGVPAKRPLF